LKLSEQSPVQQIKFFKGNEGDLARLEAEMNRWLATGVRVIQIFGNIAPQGPKKESDAINAARTAHVTSDVLVAVLYENQSG
jgi:hypothetical protein